MEYYTAMKMNEQLLYTGSKSKSHKLYIEGNKADTKVCMLYDSTYIKYLMCKINPGHWKSE